MIARRDCSHLVEGGLGVGLEQQPGDLLRTGAVIEMGKVRWETGPQSEHAINYYLK